MPREIHGTGWSAALCVMSPLAVTAVRIRGFVGSQRRWGVRQQMPLRSKYKKNNVLSLLVETPVPSMGAAGSWPAD